MRSPFLRSLLAVLLTGTGACVGGEDNLIAGVELEDGSLLLADAAVLESADDVLVFGEGDTLLVEGPYVGGARGGVQIAGLPDGWRWIGFYRRSFREVAPPVLIGRTLRPQEGGAPMPPLAPPPAWPRLILALVLLVVAGYAVWATGISGGPNHGEHPMIVSVGILIAFAAIAPEWPSPFGGAFLALVICALLLAIPVMGLRRWYQPRLTFAARAVSACLYAGMLAVMLWPKAPVASAERTSDTSVEVHASAIMSRWTLMDGVGDAVLEAPAASRHALLFAPGGDGGHSLEVRFLEGSAVVAVTVLEEDGTP